jgi:hypothetical protein
LKRKCSGYFLDLRRGKGRGMEKIIRLIVFIPSNVIRVINKSRTMSLVEHKTCMHEKYIEKQEGKITLENPRSRWKNNINISLKEIGCGIMD